MPRAFDRQPLPITNNPNDSIEFWIRRGLSESGELWRVILDSLVEKFEDMIREFLQRLLRFALDPEQAIEDLFGDLTTWAENLGAQIVSFIHSVSGLDFSSWENFVASLSDGHGIDLPGIGQALEGIDLSPQGVLNGILNALKGLLPSFLGDISIGSLTAARPNRLVSGSFEDFASIADNPKWQWDSSVTRTVDGTGSARTTAAGVLRALRSRTPVAVSAGQSLEVSSWVKCASLAGSGAAFRLDLVRYSGTPDDPTELGIDTLASVNPGAGSHDWMELSDTVTVPSGTTCVAPRLVVTAAATSGTVWFDDAVLKQTGSILLEWIPEAVTKFLGIFNIFGENGLLEEMGEAWENLLSLLGLGHKTDLLGPINLSAIWANIVEFLINPIGFFANLIDGILPDSQKPQWLSDLTDALSNAAQEVNDVGTGISNAINGIARMLGLTQAAQQSSDTANIGVQIINARLDAVGTVGFDEFDYSNANVLPTDKYALLSDGAGGGHYGPNGKGQVVWKVSGFLERLKIYKRTDMPLESDNGCVTAVWSTRIADPLFSDGYGYLCGRMYDANSDTRLEARIDNNTAVIRVINSGVATGLGSTSVSTANGDVWELWYGTLTDPYVYWLKQNGTTVLTVNDTGHLCHVGADYRMCGFGGRADNYAVIQQISPPVLNGWTWRDQNVSAA